MTRLPSNAGPARFAMALCLLLAIAASPACGADGAGGETRDAETPGAEGTPGDGTNTGGAGGNGDGTSEGDGGTAASVSTELDLGQPFAEDPSFSGELGPLSVFVSTNRSNLEQPAIRIELVHPGTTPLEEVAFTVRFDVLEGELMPAPDQDLVLSVGETQGTCSEADQSPSGSAVVCDLGTLEPAARAAVDVVVSGTFRLRTTMGLTTR